MAITRFIKRGGKLWIRVFPDKPFTKKPAETRMGKGKGPPEHWVAVVKPGRMMFEMSGVDLASATEAMELGGAQAAHPDASSSPVRRSSDGRPHGRIRPMNADELEIQAARAGRADFPAAFSADHRPVGGRQEASRSPQDLARVKTLFASTTRIHVAAPKAAETQAKKPKKAAPISAAKKPSARNRKKPRTRKNNEDHRWPVKRQQRGGTKRTRRAPRTRRRGHQLENAEDNRGEGHAHNAAPDVSAGDAYSKKYYAHDETERSAPRRYGSHRRHAAAVQAQALAAGGNRRSLHARGVMFAEDEGAIAWFRCARG